MGNAEQTREAKQLVEEARSSALAGNDDMQEMVEAMKKINVSSENISKIIKVIDDIAFQTNILALNAAVEAQRAGSHGKGFAVVAEEVRNLAGKSAAASKETAELIEDSIKKVNHGSEIAENTAAALRDIMERVDRIVELIREIAESSDIQAAEAAQIDQALSQVSNVVQTNSATSEECAAACEELSGQAENLRRLLEHYKLRE
jgi:methyl-accepting chemotaxis protein